MTKLTKVQQKIIDHCKSLHADYTPAGALDYVATYLRYTNQRTLNSLERKGYIKWVNHSQSQISKWGEAQSYWALTAEAFNA